MEPHEEFHQNHSSDGNDIMHCEHCKKSAERFLQRMLMNSEAAVVKETESCRLNRSRRNVGMLHYYQHQRATLRWLISILSTIKVM